WRGRMLDSAASAGIFQPALRELGGRAGGARAVVATDVIDRAESLLRGRLGGTRRRKAADLRRPRASGRREAVRRFPCSAQEEALVRLCQAAIRAAQGRARLSVSLRRG